MIARAIVNAALGLALAAALAAPAAAAVDVEARLSAGRIEAGGTVSLIVTVTDPSGSVADPQFQLPPGLEALGSARSQEFSWVNGRSTNQVVFRFEIGASRPGRYTIGPIRVTVGNQAYRSGELPLVVSPSGSGPAVGGGSGARGVRTSEVASLVMSLEPRDPVVGQACRLRVQLIQRVDMSEDSDYQPPATPGFWSEQWGDASRYEAREGRRTVLVTERSLRLYPLASGPATISPAYAMVTPSGGGLLDPFGGLANNRVEIVSESLRVGVRPLPGGAPAGFDGGVGRFELAWSTDRSHTTQDQSVTARLDVRGLGNLPLLRAPAFAPPEFEVFAATVDDSLPPPGTLGVGRRSFLWTLLPKHPGLLRVDAPTLVWFDPEASRYVTSTPGSLALDVLSPRASAGGEDDGGLPAVFRTDSPSPGGRAAWPPLAFAGGVLVMVAFTSWRRSGAPDAGASERARQREWLRSIGLAHGPDFWRAADEAASWLQSRGEQVLRLHESIQMARFGGRTDLETDVRRRLVERLGASIPPPPARWPLRIAAVLLAACGVALAAWSLPQPGEPELAQRAAAADARARTGRVAEAEAEWARLWDERPGDPALAARLAWGALQRDDAAAATVWVLRGEGREARERALGVIAARVRDAGGLVGAPGRALPLRSSEWAVLAFALAVAAGAWRPRRALARALLALAVVAGAWWPAEAAWRASQPLAVVRRAVAIPPGEVTLDPGQVVHVLRRGAEDTVVSATRDVAGVLPTSALWFLGPR